MNNHPKGDASQDIVGINPGHDATVVLIRDVSVVKTFGTSWGAA